jgi:hypothetical protein
MRRRAVIEVMTIDDSRRGVSCGGLARAMPDRRAGDDRRVSRRRQRHRPRARAERRADQTEKDHAALLAAIKSGRVAAEMNV